MDSYLEYEGSITIDRELMATAGKVEYELVQIVNINNDARFVTISMRERLIQERLSSMVPLRDLPIL